MENRITKKIQPGRSVLARRTLRLGFVALTDCAPLVMAKELGFFQKRGLDVALHRELGWASIRDRIIYGELDAAHALASMPLTTTMGLGSAPCECLTALVLNLHGNAITLSNRLWKHGVRDGGTLRAEINRTRDKVPTFGIVYPFSSHRHLLRQWLAAQGIHSERDVHIVVVPPPQMVANLRTGNLDGFCVGEPWNSMAVRANLGWCAATSAELSPGHPEKVLMVRRDFAEKRAGEHLALIAALLDACEFCAQPEHHDQVIATLSRPEYVNAPPAALHPGITGQFDFGHTPIRPVPGFCLFSGDNVNAPSQEKGDWALQVVSASGLCAAPTACNPDLVRRTFRSDIFEQAVRLRGSTSNETNEIQNEIHFTSV